MVMLTPRERETLAYISEGDSDKEIAFRMKLAISTVKRNVGDMLRGLKFANRVQLARWAFFYPAVFTGAPQDLMLHLSGCECAWPRCVLMAALHPPLGPAPMPKAA